MIMMTLAGVAVHVSRNFFSIATCGRDKVFSYGGADMVSYQSVNELRQFDEDKKNWIPIVPSVESESNGAEYPGIVYCPRSTSHGDYLIVFSGYDDNRGDCVFLGELNIFDMDSKSWRRIQYDENEGKARPVPASRMRCSMVYVPQRDVVIMYGGVRTFEEGPYDDVWSLDLRDFSWTLVTTATGDPPKRILEHVPPLNSKIVVPSLDDEDGELLLYMLDGETLHWTSYRTGLKEEPHFWSIHALEEDNRHRMILFVKGQLISMLHLFD